MLRKIIIPAVVIVCCMIAVMVFSEDFDAKYNTAEDCKLVRELILREIEGFVKNDAEQVYSCYSPEDVVFYGRGPEDNTHWQVSASGPEFVRQYADQALQAKQFKDPNLQHTAYIKCVHVSGNHGVAIAHQEIVRSYSTEREIFSNWFESAFFVEKIRGQWKITGAVSGIAADRDMMKSPPAQ